MPCLEGVIEEQSNSRISAHTNSIKGLTAHITWARCDSNLGVISFLA